MIRFPHPVVALLLLAGCGPIVQVGASRPPAEALLLVEASARPTPAQAGAASLSVEVPQVPSSLSLLRLPVRVSETEIRYLKDASWAEAPARQMQRLLADTLAARGLAVIDRSQGTAQAGAMLSGSLREFGLDVRNPGAAVARVRYDAQLMQAGNRTPVALRRFSAETPVAVQTPAEVAGALADASNRLAAELADWTSTTLAEKAAAK